ncbi:MAG: FKBP-type peptidyl-prolyl cis-trans isomerase [Gemmatimonadales bacterium]
MSSAPGRIGLVRLGRLAVVTALASSVGALAACKADPTDVEFEVIEDVTFASSLNIDLAAMTKLPEGVYIQDLVTGTGPGLTTGDTAWVYYELRLKDATPIGNGVFNYEVPLMGIEGWDIGVEGMRAGSTRIMLIPPELGYAETGQGAVPPGAILHFRVDLDSIT